MKMKKKKMQNLKNHMDIIYVSQEEIILYVIALKNT